MNRNEFSEFDKIKAPQDWIEKALSLQNTEKSDTMSENVEIVTERETKKEERKVINIMLMKKLVPIAAAFVFVIAATVVGVKFLGKDTPIVDPTGTDASVVVTDAPTEDTTKAPVKGSNDKWEYLEYEASVTLTRYNAGNAGSELVKVSIPDEVNNKPVTDIQDGAFSGKVVSILGEYGTFAQTYAMQNRIPLIIVREGIEEEIMFSKKTIKNNGAAGLSDYSVFVEDEKWNYSETDGNVTISRDTDSDIMYTICQVSNMTVEEAVKNEKKRLEEDGAVYITTSDEKSEVYACWDSIESANWDSRTENVWIFSNNEGGVFIARNKSFREADMAGSNEYWRQITEAMEIL